MIRRIAFVEPAASIPNIYTWSVAPRLGVPAMAAILKRAGFDVAIYHDRIRRPSLAELLSFDLTGISITTNTATEGYRYADRLRARGKTVVIGGPHATFLPDEVLRHADFVVRREGEETLLELVEALNGDRPLGGIDGLSYIENGRVTHNRDREFKEDYLSVSPDFGLIRGLESFSKGLVSRFRLYPSVYTSRGCPYSCRYCTVINIAGRRPRLRDIDTCLNDIREATRLARKDIFFVDDNLTMDVPRLKGLLARMVEAGLPRRHTFMTQIRVDAFGDDELLRLMKAANFELLHVGYESINQRTLEEWNKRQSTDDIRYTVSQASNHGLRINGMFVVGSDADTEQTVRATADIAIESGMATMQMWLLTPLPGCDVHRQMDAENRIFNRRWEHYDCQHSVFFPRLMRPSTLQRAVRLAYRKFYSCRRMFFRAPGNRITFGLNVRRMDGWMRRYERELRAFEGRFYDGGEALMTERLAEWAAEGMPVPRGWRGEGGNGADADAIDRHRATHR